MKFVNVLTRLGLLLTYLLTKTVSSFLYVRSMFY